ncbi:GNAT family N-acetyltransferase [Herbidospora galbida]|uniref:GNAT family N-acetyltransferase n=1 Tax=Herbidospora galbida TaxID=2575442 RepID=A0A4U3MC95_9ACTN|nr:GNAT family N-acetyltransferase [Herbidospora galbida]TKK86280.1 GNAT family N-acetyltransferase [Herbidospora galbida]
MTFSIHRLGVERLDDFLALAVDRQWAPEREKCRLLYEIGEVHGIDAPDGDGLAATVALVRFGTRVTAISMMLVARRYERQGIGGRLMRHALDLAGTETTTLSATTYGRPLYERLGFRATGVCDVYTGAFTGTASGRTEKLTDLAAVTKLDEEVFGAPRTELFARLPDFCESFRVTDGGFGGAWHNGHVTVLGPVVAGSAADAEDLLSDLAADVTGPIRVESVLPAAARWARDHGLTPAFSTTLMEYGKPMTTDISRVYTPVMQALT